MPAYLTSIEARAKRLTLTDLINGQYYLVEDNESADPAEAFAKIPDVVQRVEENLSLHGKREVSCTAGVEKAQTKFQEKMERKLKTEGVPDAKAAAAQVAHNAFTLASVYHVLDGDLNEPFSVETFERGMKDAISQMRETQRRFKGVT